MQPQGPLQLAFLLLVAIAIAVVIFVQWYRVALGWE